MSRSLHEQIADYIIKRVHTDSVDCQYTIYYYDIAKQFGITLVQSDVQLITDILWGEEEVADLIVEDDGFDVVLYTDYMPFFNMQ